MLTALLEEEDEGPFVLSSYKAHTPFQNDADHRRAKCTYVCLFKVTNKQILKNYTGLVGVANILKCLSGITTCTQSLA